MKASPEGTDSPENVTVGDKEGQLSPQVTDEGAGQQHFTLNTPHPALRATFPQGVKALLRLILQKKSISMSRI